VTLILLYLLVLVVVAALLFVIASAVFGRGESLPPLPRGTTATTLPASDVTGADVDALKFTQTFRGYKTSEVDWVLDRLSGEIELLRARLAAGDERLARRADSSDERLARRADSSDERLAVADSPEGRDDG
jgi:DivIVA domain-containing protein